MPKGEANKDGWTEWNGHKRRLLTKEVVIPIGLYVEDQIPEWQQEIINKNAGAKALDDYIRNLPDEYFQ